MKPARTNFITSVLLIFIPTDVSVLFYNEVSINPILSKFSNTFLMYLISSCRKGENMEYYVFIWNSYNAMHQLKRERDLSRIKDYICMCLSRTAVKATHAVACRFWRSFRWFLLSRYPLFSSALMLIYGESVRHFQTIL